MGDTKLKDHYKIETWKKIAFGIFFVLIAGFLVYISFFAGNSGSQSAGVTGNFFSSVTGGFSFTGGAITEEDLESPIEIDATLSAPESFYLDEKFSQLKISFSEKSSFNLGDQSFNFSEGDELILENYDGEIQSGNNSGNFMIEGESSKADIKGIKISSGSGKSFDVFSEEFGASSINATNVSLDSFDQKVSGEIKIGNNKFNPQTERTIIDSFIGDISITEENFSLKGKAESLEIKGSSDISVSN